MKTIIVFEKEEKQKTSADKVQYWIYYWQTLTKTNVVTLLDFTFISIYLIFNIGITTG